MLVRKRASELSAFCFLPGTPESKLATSPWKVKIIHALYLARVITWGQEGVDIFLAIRSNFGEEE